MLSRFQKSITGALAAALLTGAAYAQPAASPITFRPDAPDRYIVVPGDTLWSIAGRFTDAPWRWSELWNMNKAQIQNPHKIYPGEVIVLNRAEGRLETSGAVKLSPRVRVEGSTRTAVPTIPASAIEPFLSRPLVVEPDGLEKAPTIVGTEGNRVVIAAGHEAYVNGMSGAKEGTWYVYRRGNALVDPESKRTLGYEAVYLGAAQLLRSGDPATVRVTSSVQEILKGDKLVAAGKPVEVHYAPHAPKSFKGGRVISIYGGVGEVGEAASQAVVAINCGKSDGLEPGHVLALLRPVNVAVAANKSKVSLPDERYGLAFVFRVFDKVAYALVMNVTQPLQPLDHVRAP